MLDTDEVKKSFDESALSAARLSKYLPKLYSSLTKERQNLKMSTLDYSNMI